MLPSPRASEDVSAPVAFRANGAEIPTTCAIVIWRRPQKHRAGDVSVYTVWSALVGRYMVVGCLIYAWFAYFGSRFL